MKDLPCDFVVLNDRRFDPEHILVPTAGGPDSDLSADVARLLQREYGSRVTLLHVTDSQAEGQQFLDVRAESYDLGNAERCVETGDVERASERRAIARW